MTDAVNIISTVGFPIFCVLALGLFIYKSFENITRANREREAKLYEMIGEMRTQLNNAIEVNANFVEILSDLKNNVAGVQDEIIKIKSTLKIKEDKKEE